MPSAKARDFQPVAHLLGFVLTRTTGSHERWRHAVGRGVTIPIRGGREIGPLLVFVSPGVSPEEFERMRLKTQAEAT